MMYMHIIHQTDLQECDDKHSAPKPQPQPQPQPPLRAPDTPRALASPKKTGAADLKSLFGTGVSVKIDTPRFNVKY